MECPSASLTEAITVRLKEAGLRPTLQRVQLGRMIWGKGCNRHITADCLVNEAREHNVKVSLATIYNTLHQFTHAGLLKEIVLEGGRSYFDTNLNSHHHFLFEDTGEVMDICSKEVNIACLPTPPEGTMVSSVEVIIRVKKS